MRLFELFNSTFPLSDIGDDALGYTITFEDSTGKPVEVYMGDFETKEGRKIYGLSFERAGSDAITGDGEEFKVFSTVIAATKLLLARVQPEVLLFGADLSHGNRARLYSRLIQKFANENGFMIKPESQVDDVVLRVGKLFEGQQVFYLFSTTYQAG